MLTIKDIDHMPNDIPPFLQFMDYEQNWKDENMNNEDLHIFSDAAAYYDDDKNDLRSHIYGNGGRAITIYHQKKMFKRIIFPLSSRTHTNTNELAQIKKVF